MGGCFSAEMRRPAIRSTAQHNIWIKHTDINQIQVNWKSKFHFEIFKRIYEIIRTKLIIFFRVVIGQ